MNTLNYAAMAREYRNRWGKTGGVVLFHDGQAKGWCAVLPATYSWMPGCIALDEHNHHWMAGGGNDQDGAYYWELMQ